MYSADWIHSKDVAQFELERASQKAAQAWRFRHVRSKGARASHTVVHTLSAIAADALGSAQKALEGLKVKLVLGSPHKRFSH
jgi:hypothetical protein